MKIHALAVILFFYTVSAFSQRYVLDSIKPTLGHLIDFESNMFRYVEESATFKAFFQRLDSIYLGKTDKLHIFHIGGSHIQADVYPNKIRTYLQNMNDVAMAQRGFVFPYSLAHTNNPSNYRITAKKELWQGYRISAKKDSSVWGLSGITAAFRAKTDTIYIKANHKNHTKNPYTFDKLRLFYNTSKDNYVIAPLDSGLVVSELMNGDKMYREFRFREKIDSLALRVQIRDSTIPKPELALMGMEFMNDSPGIEYTSIGVNGASFAFYDRATFFEEQLQLYQPDLFIISIGTNDAYMPKDQFNPIRFKAYYESFIQMVLRNFPDCALLLTVPNDDYYKRKYKNPNTAVQEKIILELAKKYNLAVWDFYEIMGGYGSSNLWFKNQLMRRDRIHFTSLGYSIKADLFMEAFIKAWATTTLRPEEELLEHFKNLDE